MWIDRVGYPTLLPLAGWCEDLRERVDFLLSWAQEGQPISIWLPALFSPQVHS
jgi:hypothetical protein